MYLFSCLLCVSSFYGVMSQTLTQSSSEVTKPGERMKMSCTGSGFQIADYLISWVQQIPGGGLTWIGWIDPADGETKYSSAFQGRFTITADKGINTAYLEIGNLKVEDTATYYCARRVGWQMGAYMDLWGAGSSLVVTSAASSAPSLFPLISCGKSTGSGVTIGCLAINFIPDSIEFSWQDKINNSFSTEFKQYKSVVQGGTYLASSQVTVPTSSWDNYDPYYCKAKHSLNTKTVEVIRPKSPIPDTNPPTVTMHAPIKEDLQKYGNSTIVCHMSNFRPGNIEVKWMKNGKPIADNVITEDVIPDGNGGFMRSSFITVSISEWNADTLYSSIVKHAASNFSEIRNLSKSSVCDIPVAPSGIVVFTIPPSFETLYMEKKAPLTCLITNMNTDDGLEVVWYDGDKELSTELLDRAYNDNHTYSIKAIATVCPEDWNNRKTFECRVTHPDLPEPQKVKLVKPNEKLSTPAVYVYGPHQDELAKKEVATLSCMVKNLYPADAFVKWLDSNDKELTNVVTTGPIKEGNLNEKETYFMYSMLTLPSTEDWNMGKRYTCMVGHESLPLQAIQRSIDKTAGKPTSLNLTLNMSDTCS